MDEDALARKRKLHGVHRSSATRIMGQVEALIAMAPINLDELALLQANLSSKRTKLEALDTEIVEITPQDQLEEEIGKADEYTERIQKILLQIDRALKPTPPHDTPS